ncbi:MAG: tetratricopeptide repeat protein [Opitutaceae bacterium]
MSQLPPTTPDSPQADAATVPVAAPSFEVIVHAFWEKNRNFIFGLCAAALVAIVVREGWQYFAAQHEAEVQADYARIAEQPTRLTAFAEAHAGHALAGVAYLKLADDKFSAGDFTGAAPAYAQAASQLKNAALVGRAQLGAAISQFSGADKTAGEAALKKLSADATLLKSVRAEATYHLASVAAAAGKAVEVKQLAEQISQIDATGAWAQRATMLLSTLPADNSAVSAPAAGLNFKAGK